jgi:hypothetical protein
MHLNRGFNGKICEGWVLPGTAPSFAYETLASSIADGYSSGIPHLVYSSFVERQYQ